METPIQDVIIGNIPGALGVESRSHVNRMNTTVKPGVNDTQRRIVKNTDNNPQPSGADNEQDDDINRQTVMTTEISTTETCAAAQTKSMGVREEPKLLKINEVTVIGSEELEAQQIAGNTLQKEADGKGVCVVRHASKPAQDSVRKPQHLLGFHGRTGPSST